MALVAVVPKEAVLGNEKWEGFHKLLPDGRAKPYLCPAKVATVGIGTTVYRGQRKVKMTDPPITRDEARELLAYDLRTSAASVARDTSVELHRLMFASLIMFSYNCGTSAYRGSTLRYFINRKEWDKAGREFMKWVNGGGVRLQGLVNRRDYERLMFLQGALELKKGLTGMEEAAPPIAQPKTIEALPVPRKSLWQRFIEWTGL